MRPLRALKAMVVARWPSAQGPGHDAAREEQRRALARFFAKPEAPADHGGLTDARGFAGTPGVGAAILAQRLALADPPDHAGAAEAFALALRTIPTVDDNESDTTRQSGLAQALALMALAHHAVRAGLAERRWGLFGDAAACAALAVSRQPLLPYLRFEYAEVLRLLGRRAAAFGAMRDALPLAAGRALAMRVADTAGEIAAVASEEGDAEAGSLLAAAEAEFLSPLFAAERDDGPADPPEADTEARDLAWWVAFRAGKVALARARAAEQRDAAAAAFAQLAARRFSRALALMQKAANPVPEEHARNLVEWRLHALREAAELQLGAGLAGDAAASLDQIGDNGSHRIAHRIKAWLSEGRPERFAAVALLGTGRATDMLAMPALAASAKDRIDPRAYAIPAAPEPVVVEVTDPLLVDEALAHAIIGGEAAPTIAALRERLRARFGFRLPGVRLRGVDDPIEQRRITVRLGGRPTPPLCCVPPGAALALASAGAARQAGLMPVAGRAPEVDGSACTWVKAGERGSGAVAVRDPAYAIVGTLETALLRNLPRLVGLDDASALLPALDDAALPAALSVLRALLAERTGIDDAVRAHVAAGLAAGDTAGEIVRTLRLKLGFRGLLWGNERGRHPLRLSDTLLGGAISAAPHGVEPATATDIAAAIAEDRMVTVLVPNGQMRHALRAALSSPPESHAWLADIPVLAEDEWRDAP